MVMYKIDRRGEGGGSKNRSLGQTLNSKTFLCKISLPTLPRQFFCKFAGVKKPVKYTCL